MSKKLEDFINQHRREFDTDQPPARVWEHVRKNTEQPQKKTAVNLYRWVAAAAVIMMICITVSYLVSKDQVNPISVKPETKDDILNSINPVYAKEVYHFTQLIELKQNELKQIGKDQPELYQQFLHDINNLDSSYTSLQKELPANPNREQLLEAMIQNLQLQTELLNQQLRVIKQIKQSKISSNENNSKSI